MSDTNYEALCAREDAYFESWKKDRLTGLMEEFIDEHSDQFAEFCRVAFKAEVG